MATGRKYRDIGDYFPQMESSPVTSQEDLPKSSRSVTPRGQIFPTLGEAHQAIAFKPGSSLASNGSIRKVSGSPASPEESIPLDDLEPRPLPLKMRQAMRVDFDHTISHSRMTTNEVTAESDDDPFPYDNGSWTVFLKPSKEREVSAVLHCVSGANTLHSKETQGTICSPDGTPIPSEPVVQTYPPLPPLPLVPSIAMADVAAERDTPLQAQTQYFQNSRGAEEDIHTSSAIQSPWAFDKDPYEAEVSGLVSVRAAHHHISSRILALDREQRQVTPDVKREHLFGGSVKDNIPNLKDVISDGDEWETVETNPPMIDSNQTFYSRTGVTNSRGMKTTGSSIADFSDDASHYAASSSRFASTDRILQHPTGHEPVNGMHLRNLKESGRPIFLPKPRDHRVNGYPQDSLRVFKFNTPNNAKNVGTSLGRKISNPFRKRSSSRKRELERSPFGKRVTSPKWEFRDSLNSVDANELRVAVRGSCVHHAPRTDEGAGAPVTPAQPYFTESAHTTGEDKLSSYPDSGSPSDIVTPHRFTFSLIPLPEAARIQAQRRASGDEDHTVTGSRNLKTTPDCRVSSDGSRASYQNRKSFISRTTNWAGALKPVGRKEKKANGARSQQLFYHRAFGSSEPNFERRRRARNALSRVSSSESQRSQLQYGRRFPLSPGETTQVVSTPRSYLDPSFPSPLSAYDPPHLYPKSERHGRHERRRRAPDTNSELQTIAYGDTEPGVPVTYADAWLSWEAQKRRQLWFYFMCALCILPFFALMIHKGKFDPALSWFTKGETDRLSWGQRRVIKILNTISLTVYTVGLFVLVVMIATRLHS